MGPIPVRKKRLLWIGAALYVVLLVGVIGALYDARSRMTARYGSAQEQQHWEEFRGEMDRRHIQRENVREELARHSGQPIRPAPPKARSPRPPALELLQNHFAACLAVCIAGATLLFGILWGFFMGAMLRPGRKVEESAGAGDSARSPK